MKKLWQHFCAYFSLSRGEQRGVLAFLLLWMLLLVSLQAMQLLPPKLPQAVCSFEGGYDALGDSLASSSTTTRSHSSPFVSAFSKRKALVFPINSCDTLDLCELYGIGPATARRIVRYREQLGGFVSIEQLKEVWGMDSARYAILSKALVIDGGTVRKIPLNSITLDSLKKHPYLDWYQAKSIIQSREKHGPFPSLEALRQLPLIDDSTYFQLLPYLKLE